MIVSTGLRYMPTNEQFENARKNLVTALGLLDQIKAAAPPYFVQRIQACVIEAMKDLGMRPKS